MTAHVLGIDGGGTRTRAAIFGSDGQLLGIGYGGPSNYDDVGAAAAQRHIDDAVCAAEDAAGVGRIACAAAFLGMAGVVSALDAYRQAILERLPLADLRWPELPPVLGAGILALQLAGIEVDRGILRRLDEAKGL